MFVQVALVGVQHVLLGHIADVGHPADGGDLLPHRRGGGVVAVGVQKDHRLVLAAQVADHAVHIDFHQAGQGVQAHADGQGRHAGNGHGPVGAKVAQAAAGQKSKRRKFHRSASSRAAGTSETILP